MAETARNPSTDIREEIARLIAAAGDTGEVDTYAGKRCQPRVSEGLQLELTTDASGSGKCRPVSMHNISERGFALWSKQKIDRSTRVFVRQFTAEGPRPWIPATVTHCTVGIRGFLIGAEFHES
ncbi:MAG: hypothetical protein HY287_04220 [Planctomycetes bacterium]|nr:hypothetical protein [Planctomycetota bacterium]MBI3833519.1 hypothetical protein [Planctomycetota bacterium]